MASNSPFAPFSIGSVMRDAEALKSMRRQSVLDDLQTQYLGGQIKRAEAAEGRAVAQESRQATQFDQEQQVVNTRLLNMAAAEVAQNPAAASRWDPIIKAAIPTWEPIQGGDPAQIQAAAKQLYESTSAALQAYGGSQGTGVQSTQVLESGNLALVMRDGSVRDTGQAVRPQIVVRDVNGVPTVVTATGTNATMTPLSNVPSEADAAATIAGAESDARNRSAATADQNKELVANQRTLEVWSVAKQGLVNALSGASTGPVQGRLPAVTAAQQTADGAVAAVAPVLKQLFRSAGEGVFTDRDQALLLEMVPDRKDHPETRVAKIEMIDAIIQAKLAASVPGGGSEAPSESGGWSIRQVE